MMSDDQHGSLWNRYKEFRTLEDRDQLVYAYQHLVSRFRPKQAHISAWFDEDDFAQAGVIGLCEAIERFNPDMGVPFERYAALRITGAMTDATRKDGLDWASRRTRENLGKIDRFRENFLTKHAREPNAIEIAEGLGIGNQIVAELMNLATAHDKGALPLAPEVSDAIVSEVAESEWWRQAVRDLPEPEKSVVFLHYLESLTIEDVSTALGIGSVTIHKMKKRAMEKLREASAEYAA